MTLSSRQALTFLASTLFLLIPATSFSQSVEAPRIGSVRILFGDDEVTKNRFAVRAFVPTGSSSDRCLATLSDTNFAIPGMSVFCAPREFKGQKGLLFSVFFPEPIPDGLILSATIYQEGAVGYGAPVFDPE